jgi:prevent-host-death family protein
MTMRELTRQTARLIGAVERGDPVTVTKDGRHIATIVPPHLAKPVYPFRTDPMGAEIDDMPAFPGGDGRIIADLDRLMERFAE